MTIEERLSRIERFLIKQHELNSSPSSTVQYSCPKCGYEFSLCKDTPDYCPGCGWDTVAHWGDIKGTIVSVPNLWNRRKDLDVLAKELMQK